ncbi:sensor histidine kinase, partial [Okeania sp. SIO2G5]|uniref:sensor histidine kinase n=1 Tax=Okeania sp. SIO2G5 TaxID=2607796 RepID=UPI0013C1A187
QTEKMSGLGQMVAGIAHEINNPVSFIYGNLDHVKSYAQNLIQLINLYQKSYPEPIPEIQALLSSIDLDFLIPDLEKVLGSMETGAERITDIVTSLRNFSRLDEAEKKDINIHTGLDSTLVILQSRIKAVGHFAEIEIIKDYGNIPNVLCYASQLNQVFMNLFVNAIDALEEQRKRDQQATIRIQTSQSDNEVSIVIEDNGPGMDTRTQHQIFDPFFTTKPIGKGTGLGLSISYQIIVEKHGGSLDCWSMPGQGTVFTIKIPFEPFEAMDESSSSPLSCPSTKVLNASDLPVSSPASAN